MWNKAFVKRDMGVLTASSPFRSTYSKVKMEKAIRSQVDRILLSCGSPGGLATQHFWSRVLESDWELLSFATGTLCW